MNKIYRLKFDKRRNELVVVSEITAGMGKEKSTGHIADLSALSPFRKLLGTLTPLALLTGLIAGLLPAMVLANPDLPTGGQIVGGQGSISTSGNQMTIHQQTQNMATNWHSFDVGQNNTVQFVQPDSSSVALNRVTGVSGSQIMGTLKANGQVFILNPNGVLFGKDARVNVAGLVASTKNINTADFMKGQYTLSGSGTSGAQVINQGSLTTSKGGYIVLAGERVSNSGTVTTPGGKTVLAAGKTVTLQLDNGGLTSVSVNGSVVNALVENRGLISATNGQVYLTAKGQDMLLNTVVNNSGTIEAKGLASRGGEIVLNGGDSGVVSQSGRLLADSLTGQGGKITLEGQNIHLAGSSLTSATGKTGGGEVYVGGGWQGKDSVIKNASKVVMDKAATVDVSATDAGNGGTAVLWSDDYTNFRGTVLAKGGTQSGNGGRVETSSHKNLQAFGEVNTSARAGYGGEWLLDPTDVTIVGAGTDTGVTSTTADGADIFTPTVDGAKILNTSIQNQLNAGTNVTIKTSGTDTVGQAGNITVNANIIKTTGADATLTLLADNNIVTKDAAGPAQALQIGAVGADAGKLNLNLLAGNTSGNSAITLGKWTNISLNGGDFLADAAGVGNSVSLGYNNNGQIHGGNVTLNVSGGLNGYAYRVLADNDLTINGPVSGRTGWGAPLSFTAGGMLTMTSPGTIDLQAADTSNGGGSVVISGAKGVSLTASQAIILKGASARGITNKVNVTSSEGDITLGNVDVSVADGRVELVNSNITSKGSITVSGNGGNNVGVNIESVNFTADENIKITGNGTGGGGDAFNSKYGGIRLVGYVEFHAKSGELNGTVVRSDRALDRALTGGIVTGQLFSNTNILFDGSFNIKGIAYFSHEDNGAPNVPAGIFESGGAGTTLTFSNGDSTYYGEGVGVARGLDGAVISNSPVARKNIILKDGANLNMIFRAENEIAYSTVDPLDANGYSTGYDFSGQGNVSIGAYNNSINQPTIYTNLFSNKRLEGSLSINAVNQSGDAIVLAGRVNADLVNATITGTSGSSTGVKINTNGGKNPAVNLDGNKITGNSETGSGIVITGNNVTITNGTLTGTAAAGDKPGVSLAGGSNFILDGANITGNAVDGAGVSVSGTLQVNNGTSVNGTANGTGAGIAVNGTLTTTSGDGIRLTGAANGGDGIQVRGETSLSNATINGTSVSGTGTNINAPLTLNGTTSVSGNSVSGVGLNIAKTVTVAEADRENITFTGTSTETEGVIIGSQIDGGTVTGTSVSGDGIVLTNNADIKQTTLNGSSTEGGGVRVNAAVTLDESSAKGLKAGSTDGSGLVLKEGADVSVVQDGTVTPVTTA
ncbi:filamentous hemagglutinin N-terminal domain-containing protein, partial [Salmonella enterica]|nr:filamentous hemagglutinin N-terminal domain-containing protein [Salmonella enterica]EMD3918216.1 filamentous hemagglutinin N-terminal domain-containing protein [Salmonella enterica]